MEYRNNSGRERRGRGRGRGTRPNYKELGQKQLQELFPDIEKDIIGETFRLNEFDMASTTKKLCELSGKEYIDDTEDVKNPVSGFTLNEIIGDLFTCGDDVCLAHCVSQDLAMGKGTAVLFKEKFGGINDLRTQNKKIGEVAILKRGSRYIYYLITKLKYWDKPTYNDLKESLVAMKDHVIENKVESIGMPRIGCGLDGLIWSQVKSLLKELFWDVKVTISIYRI